MLDYQRVNSASPSPTLIIVHMCSFSVLTCSVCFVVVYPLPAVFGEKWAACSCVFPWWLPEEQAKQECPLGFLYLKLLHFYRDPTVLDTSVAKVIQYFLGCTFAELGSFQQGLWDILPTLACTFWDFGIEKGQAKRYSERKPFFLGMADFHSYQHQCL